MYALPHTLLKVSSIDENELNLFVKDTPFNFTLKQALESLGDLEALAEVAQLQAIIAQILVHTEFAHII
jgi:hypothetical protein